MEREKSCRIVCSSTVSNAYKATRPKTVLVCGCEVPGHASAWRRDDLLYQHPTGSLLTRKFPRLGRKRALFPPTDEPDDRLLSAQSQCWPFPCHHTLARA